MDDDARDDAGLRPVRQEGLKSPSHHDTLIPLRLRLRRLVGRPLVAALAAGCTALSATTRPLRIGTRGSPLALAQAYMTRQLLMDNFEELSSEGAIQLVRSCFLF